jgi:hypothetical protein
MARTIIGISISLAIVFVLRISAGYAQEQDGWSPPVRLSMESSEASEAFMTSDQYGYVHVFWTETSASSNTVIMYSRFDGENWTDPVDILGVEPGGYTIGDVSPDVDASGILHLVWTEGNTGPVYYSHAPAANAVSARHWSPPVRIDIQAYKLKLLVDSEEGMHILFANFYGSDPGIFYTRSENGGLTWSNSTWLDPDIPVNHAPSDLKFAADGTGGLHAAWVYFDLEAGITDMVRYSHWRDDGDGWSSPFTIDEADESSDELRKANIGLVAQGHNVHVTWAGTESTHREHRFSVDGGLSWSEPSRIFGNLLGESIGDGLAVDALGRAHFVGTLRWPAAVWHAYWDNDHWSEPSIAYLISWDDADDKDPLNDRIHAHNVRLAIRSGNQLVVTFTNSPQERPFKLYAMHHTLRDVSSLEPLPPPRLNSPSQILPDFPESSVPKMVTPTSVAIDRPLMDNPPESNSVFSQNQLLLGIYPALTMVLLVIVFQRLRKR